MHAVPLVAKRFVVKKKLQSDCFESNLSACRSESVDFGNFLWKVG